MKTTIVTWNMAHWTHRKYSEAAWNYLLNDIDADFILCQEAVRPEVLEGDDNFIWHKTRAGKEWGTGIYSKKYTLSQEPDESIPCWSREKFNEFCVVANSKVENTELTLISLYGRLDPIQKTGYSIPNLHRILSDLTGIFNGHFGKRNIVLGGDFNASEQYDCVQKNSSHRLFFERLEDFKLEDSFKLNGNEDYVQTLRHNRSKVGWQNDYIFISRSISKKFEDCMVIDNEEIGKCSDHNPVIVTLDL